VVLGSERQYEIIAASLEGLLAKIAPQRFEEEGAWTDFTPHEDADDATDELAEWLRRRLGIRNLYALTKMSSGLPDFTQWMEQWCRDREAL
jgi:hypothetical protein